MKDDQNREVKCPRCQEVYLVKKGDKIKINCSRCGAKFEKLDAGIWKITKGS